MSDKIIISADCVCDLPDDLIKEYSIQMIPFYIQMRGVRFEDYTEIDFDSVYEYMEEGDEIIASASASVEDYREYFQKISENGTVVHICVSGKLSHAYENALAAAKDMENVYVVDSRLVSHGLGLLVLKAAKMAETNVAVETIIEELQNAKNRISCSFVLKSTQYVANNNRLNQMLSNLLDIFRIKPIIKVCHDGLKIRGICLGNSEFYTKRYIKKILGDKKNISEDILFITALSHSEEFKKFVYREAAKKIKWKHIYVQEVSATNFCNIGIGSVGLMFYTK